MAGVTCPRGYPHLLPSVVVIGPYIILVCRTEKYWSFLVSREHRTLIHGLLELSYLLGQFPRSHII